MSFPEKLYEPLRKLLEQADGRALSTREIIERLAVGRSDRKAFRRWLKDLSQQGEIVRYSGAKWTLPKQEHLTEGVVECHPDGYAFIRPDQTDVEDVFVPPGDLLDAMHGDRVKVRITRSRRDGRRSGRVVDVVERSVVYVVGKYDEGHLYPTNERILERIFIPPKARRGVVDGELAEARITTYPSSGAEPAGEIVCRLGSFDDPGVDLALMISEHNLPREFPPEVISEAEALPDHVLPEEIEGRKDLRDLPLVTVDPESARDFDDAVYTVRERSGWRLWVAIADVSHYVKPGTYLDEEAFARSTSVYFPEAVLPMLPKTVSAGIASLKPDVDRLAMVVEMTFAHDAAPLDATFYPAVIRSAARMSYNQVRRAVIENDPAERERIADRIDDLEVMLELSQAIRKRRRKRGTLDFDLPEAMVILGAEGHVEEITKSSHDPSHQMVEEFMIAANEAVARYMEEKGLPSMYRVHEPPAPEKLEALSAVLGAFGLKFDYRKMGEQELSRSLQKTLAKTEGKSYETVAHSMILRSMKQARYDPANRGHFGLASDHYLHFTSPIRRYPDLFVHTMLMRHLAGKPPRPPGDMVALAMQCSQLERRAEEAERDMDKLKAARFMKERIGQEYDGYVVSVTSFGMFIEITEHFVEGLVHESRLPPDVYKVDEKTMSLVGKRTRRRWRVGDEVRVVVAGASIEKRQVDFDLLFPSGKKK